MKNNINVLIYEGKSGTRVELKSDASETMWGTQEQIATIFERSNTTISEHILNIYTAAELIVSRIDADTYISKTF